MATEPDFSLDLFDFGDDEHFPCFLTVREDGEEVLLVSSDDDLAARVQFQEVLMDSFINLNLSGTMLSPSPSSSSSSVMTNGILLPSYLTDQPSLYVKCGEPYERFCGLCLFVDIQRDFQEQLVTDQMKNVPVETKMEKDSLNAMKDQEEDGQECSQQSTEDPSNAQDTAQPMKNKGKEKESF